LLHWPWLPFFSSISSSSCFPVVGHEETLFFSNPFALFMGRQKNNKNCRGKKQNKINQAEMETMIGSRIAVTATEN
jgi:hypothetical protein